MNEELKLEKPILHKKQNESKKSFGKYESWNENPMNAIIGLSELLVDTKLMKNSMIL